MSSGSTTWSPTYSQGDPVVSFSQNAEDIRLWRVFSAVENGFYVDVGAADPTIASVTRLFYEHGWSGINIEPSPTFNDLVRERERDLNLQIAIGESEGTVRFFVTYPFLGMSTLDPAFHEHVPTAVEKIEEIAVPQRRLGTVLRENAGDRTIHFLKVDVEGAEAQVLASSDWASFRPIVVVVEAVASCSITPMHASWEHVLIDAGYELAVFDGINRFYVDRSHSELIPSLAYPVSALDHFVPAALRDLKAELGRVEAELTEARRAVDVDSRSRRSHAERVIAAVAGPVRTVRERARRGFSNQS